MNEYQGVQSMPPTDDLMALPEIGIGLVELTGTDTLEWLQGQATNNLAGLQAGDPISFCLRQPTGQMLALCDVWRIGDSLLIATDNVEAVLERSEKMVVLEDVQAKDLSDAYKLHSVQGRDAQMWTSHVQNDIYPNCDPLSCWPPDEGLLIFRSPRVSPIGYDVWVPAKNEDPFVWPGSNKQPFLLPEDTYEAIRIECGVPKRGADYNDKTLPPELGPAFDKKYVSYNKGCYTGQEVLMRIHSRGHTNKT